MNRRILFVLALAAWAALACLDATPARAQQGHPVADGHVTMHIGRGAMLISATGGKGTLTFQGQKHTFHLGGLGIGLLGVTVVDAQGEVYNLKRLEDFTGVYGQVSADWALGEGEGVLMLQNSKGVVMKLRSRTKGVSLAVGGEGLDVQFGDIPKQKRK